MDILGIKNGSVKTTRQLSAFLWLLQRSLEMGFKIEWDDVPKLFRTDMENVIRLQAALSKIAWINVKKASRSKGTKMDANEVYEHALRNRAILLQQIQIIAPHLVIICGNAVIRAVDDLKIFGPEILRGQKWKIKCLKDNPHILLANHPTNWRAYRGLYKSFEDVYSQMSIFANL